MSKTETSEATDAYLPIGDYGIIGNLETVALIGMNGSIDFMCYPHFDSPSLFCRLLDQRHGGFFQISPTCESGNRKQMYLPDTNILVTRFHTPRGVLEIIDFMPLGNSYDKNHLVRIIKSVRGEIEVKLECRCSFDYARTPTNVALSNDRAQVHFDGKHNGCPTTCLHSQIPLDVEGDVARSVFTLKQNEEAVFSFACAGDSREENEILLNSASDALKITADYWRDWVSKCTYRGKWLDKVKRSALTLKLLFSRDHGSMVAAPTFSLPEAIGGVRNWDYRYCWIRDSAFTMYSLLKLGFNDEATHYMEWVTDRYEHCTSDGQLQLMYRLDGSEAPNEEHLEHFEGYKHSQPVRIGNAAKHQLQLDIYGELIDCVYLANKYSSPITTKGWNNLSRTVEFVCKNWHKPDESIWEFRGGRKHFLHSQLMCWVAIDRALRISEKESLPAPVQRWRQERDRIYRNIHQNFWNPDLQAFTQYKNSSAMDASVLLMPIVKFMSPNDPLWLSTLKALQEQLVSDTFVKRYDDNKALENLDGSEEGSFTMCTFWYCEILARSGQIREATLLFEKMLGYANHLGLFAEQLGLDGEQLGNFPQAFTHLALVSAASAIDEAEGKGSHTL